MSRGAVNFNKAAIEYYTPKSLVDIFGKFDEAAGESEVKE